VKRFDTLESLATGSVLVTVRTSCSPDTSKWVSFKPGQDGNKKSLSISLTTSCFLLLPDFEELPTNFAPEPKKQRLGLA
jgi:hypothetical protein